MAVICVARELAALGDETIKELSAITGYRSIDKDYVEQRLTQYGIKPDTRAKYDEKKPGFWASLSQDRDDYLHYLKTVLYEEATKGDCIVAGRGGFAVFSGVPGIISVKLVAPRSVRLRRLREHFSCDERRADSMLKESDHDRKGFHDYFFNVDWNDPANFDLVMNTAREHPATVAGVIDQLRRLVITEEAEKACGARLAELSLGQRIVTEIVYARRIPVHFLEADVRGAKVVLHGVANTQSSIDAAGSVAMQTPGVDVVENAIQVVQEFAVMP
ncbi:MAG TPA: cytidylate kinase family protein [Spirochaetales bacterium]|nr:cytidylate kinase family protein [Spirochaetia bacterium]HPE36079.1 cytidylate kinase family protein [Spirochaetales bacterium]